MTFPLPLRYAGGMNAKTIISASRRTDLPAYYMDWFLGRLRDGYAISRNPMNPNQARRVSLLPDDVRCVVFWSKNPAPLLTRLDALSPYAHYLQYTLNAYGRDIEPGMPSHSARVGVFSRLADALGAERVRWRYDPILFAPAYGPAYHVEAFARTARALRGYTRCVTVSFLDLYAKIHKNVKTLSLRRPDEAEAASLLKRFAQIAGENGLSLRTCAEAVDYGALGIGRGRCIDPALIGALTGEAMPLQRDKNQRPACGCAPSVDIGMYHTCPHGCAYCYANFSQSAALRARARHDPAAPSLFRHQDKGESISSPGIFA